jgi:FtsZ-binding cell division protein ZapB
MKIKAAFVFFAIASGVISYTGFKEIDSLRSDLEQANSTIDLLSKNIKSLRHFNERFDQYVALKNHSHSDNSTLRHSHFEYASEAHTHNYADDYHTHSNYADKDEFEELKQNFDFLKAEVDMHRFDSRTHHRHE